MRIFYKKNKHMMTLVVVLALLIQMVVPGMTNYAFAEGGKNLGDQSYEVITSVKATGSGGTELEGYVAPDAIVYLEYTWKLEDSWEVGEGDYFIVSIPGAFDLGEASFDGKLSDGYEDYGTWKVDVTTRQLKLTFSDLADKESNVSGEVKVKLKLRLEEIKVELPYTLEIPISGSQAKSYTITTKPKNGSSIEKNGEVFKEGTVEDINKQTWTIDINTSLDVVSEATVTDKIDERLGYVSGSMKVHELKVYSNGEIELGDEVNSGYSVDYNESNELKVTFDGSIDKAYRLVYDTEIKEIDTTETTFIYKNEATFNGISDDAAVTVERKPLIEKEGDPSSVFNADSITWQIKVNQSLYKLNGVKVEDTIPKGLSLDGVKVYLMPEKTLQSEGESEAYIYTWDNDRKTFTIEFNEEIDEEYLIEYTTTINEDELKNNKDEIRFTNTAKVTQDGSAGEVPAGTTITVKKGRLINKKGIPSIGYDDEKYIDWEIDVNLGEIELNTKTVLDEMGTGLKLDTTKTIDIYPLTIDKTREENNITEGTKLGLGSYTIKYGDNNEQLPIEPTTKFKIEFENNITSAYRIKYRTIITKHESGKFTNTGTVDGIIGEGQTGPGSVNPTIENYFNKDFVGTDYETKVLNWKITIDPRKNGIDNLEITDTFDDGMLMTDSQFNGVVVKKGNEELTKGEGQDYTLERTEKDSNIKGFTLIFNKQVNQGIYTIEYSTTMDPDMHPVLKVDPETGEKTYEYLTYKNGVKFIKQGKNSNDIEKDVDPKVNNDAKTNGNKKGRLDAANKQVHWEINLNYLSKNMKNLIVNDAIIGNQKLVADSVKVYKYTVDANGRMSNDIELTEVEKAGINIEEAQDGKSFIVAFPDKIVSPYRIRYSTEFVGISQILYENKAVTNYGDYYAKVEHPDGDKFVFKDGAINGDNTVVEWEIVVNKSQSTISDITLTDTLSEGLELIEDSFELFEGDSIADGKKITFSEYFKIVPHPKELAIDPQVFDIVSLRSIDKTYTIKYRTNIIKEDILDQKLTNEVSFKGTGVEQGKKTDTKEIAATFVTGTGSGKGEVGKFKIIKIDGNDDTKKLAGVKFKLTRNLGGKLKELGEIVTDENGEFTSAGLKYATYILEEIEVPYGYQLSSEKIEIVVNTKHDLKIEEKTIKNYELGSIKINKTDKDNLEKKLSGAVFTVKDSEGTIVGTITTGADGTGTLGKLNFGTYTVVETKAPYGYMSDTTEHQIEISIDDKDGDGKVILVKELNVTNEKKPIGPGPDPKPPTKPEEPEKPTEPPTKPEEPEKPTEPPTKPEEPEKPTEPPTKPEEPEKPTEPPTKPEEPEKPTEPPTESEKPEKPTVVTPPENGTVEFDEDGNWKYTPNPGFKGKDKFVIKHPDGTEELIEIDVDDIPLGTVLPKTGESSSLGYYLGGLLLVLIGLFLRKKIV